MDRKAARNAIIALLGGVAVVLAARTLPTATRTGQGGGVGDDEASGDGIISRPPDDTPVETVGGPVPFLSEVVTALALLGAVLALWYIYHNRRDVFRMALVVCVFGGALILLSRLVSPDSAMEFAGGPLGLQGGESAGAGSGNDEPVTTAPPTQWVLVVVLAGLLFAGVVGVVARRTTTSEENADAAGESTDEARAVGQVAGDAADRIEDGTDPDNAVYQAWVDMTELLDVSRTATKTPGEFADAAVDSGIDADDVRELTALFERVRYGTETVSETDEQQAIELLRRIESTYTGDPEG